MSGKNALVHPSLKKPGLELVNKNFCPISNLQFTSKLTEKAAAIQLQTNMLTNGLFSEMQSAYRAWASLHWDGVTESQEWYSDEYGYGSCVTPSSFGPERRLWYCGPRMTFLFIDFSHCLAYMGQLFNGFDPIWEVDRNKLKLMVLFPKSLASTDEGCLRAHALAPCFLLSMLASFSVLLNLTCRLHTRTQMILNYTCRFAH